MPCIHSARPDSAADRPGPDGNGHVAGHSDPGSRDTVRVAAAMAAGEPAGWSSHADLDALMPVFERLVADTVAQIMACPAKPDPTFAGFEELLAPIRSATTLEGTLLERGIEAVCGCRDDLMIVTIENPLPVIAEARAFLKRNDWSKASALRHHAGEDHPFRHAR